MFVDTGPIQWPDSIITRSCGALAFKINEKLNTYFCFNTYPLVSNHNYALIEIINACYNSQLREKRNVIRVRSFAAQACTQAKTGL